MKDEYLTPKDINDFNRRIVHPPSPEVLQLSKKDGEIFAEALLNPPLPNDALRRSSMRYMDGKPKIVVD